MSNDHIAEDVRVEVRVVDLYELVRFYYGSPKKASRAATSLAADRCNIALLGVPKINEVLRQFDGADRAAQ